LGFLREDPILPPHYGLTKRDYFSRLALEFIPVEGGFFTPIPYEQLERPHEETSRRHTSSYCAARTPYGSSAN